MASTGTATSKVSTSIVSDITAAGIFGILNTSFMVSYATLIFSKTCPDFFGAGVALFLVGACVVSVILALLSTYSGTIGSIQDVPAAISAIIALSLAQLLSASPPETLFANIFATIAVSTVLTGIAFLLLGYFKLGNLVRFIPYPVLGGFLAATGWLLFTGGIQVSTGVALKVSGLITFLQNVPFIPLFLALAFAVTLLTLTGKYPKNMFITPATILITIVTFILVALAFGVSIDQLKQDGWLLGPLPDGPLWKAATLPDITRIDWVIVLQHAGSIATIVTLSATSFLLNSSGIEVIAGRDLDMNKDLKATGIANLATAIIAAPASYVLVSQTALATRIGAVSRMVGVMQGMFLLLVFFVGGTFLAFFPNFVAGGLLLYLGLSMLKEWVVDSRKSISRVDYAIIISIVLVVEFFGFLQGVAVGVVASVVIFVIRYSTINIIKEVRDGSQVRSSKDRPITDQRMLDYHAESMLALQLQGFIFFGTANSLYEKVKNLASAEESQLRFLIMNLKLVQGIDSSAVQSFSKLAKHLEKQEIPLVLVNLSQTIEMTLRTNGFTPENYPSLHEFADMDHATEYCEDRIIAVETKKIQQAKDSTQGLGESMLGAVYSDMMAALEIQVMFESLTEKMKPYLQEMAVREGDQLYAEHDESSDIFFIVRGQVTLSRKDSEGKLNRIRTLGPWTITGELGSYLGYHAPYDANVVKGGLVYRLSDEKRKKIEQDNPSLASEFQKLIIIMLGNQLMKTSQIIGEN